MAESGKHMGFVRNIVTYLSTMPFIIPELIESDLPEYSTRTTQAMNRYYPDVYYCDGNNVIIGEAKTDNDIDNIHTQTQIDAYISHLEIFNLERHLILSGSFYSFPELKNLIIRKKRHSKFRNINFHIIAPLHKPLVI